jgi:hypothetical protein
MKRSQQSEVCRERGHSPRPEESETEGGAGVMEVKRVEQGCD